MKENRKNQRNVCGLRSLLVDGVAFGLGILGLPAEETSEALLREWKSGNGRFSVKASLESIDVARGQVLLRKEDSSLIKVPLARLSATDQSYLKELAAQQSGWKDAPDPVRLHGLQWQPEMETALKLAAGGPSTLDDQPVMWFRVLGQLDDGM